MLVQTPAPQNFGGLVGPGEATEISLGEKKAQVWGEGGTFRPHFPDTRSGFDGLNFISGKRDTESFCSQKPVAFFPTVSLGFGPQPAASTVCGAQSGSLGSRSGAVVSPCVTLACECPHFWASVSFCCVDGIGGSLW